MAHVKTESARPDRGPRLAPCVKERLEGAGITHRQVAEAAPEYHPEGWPVTRPFVTQVLNGQMACPDWLRRELDELLAEAEGED